MDHSGHITLKSCRLILQCTCRVLGSKWKGRPELNSVAKLPFCLKSPRKPSSLRYKTTMDKIEQSQHTSCQPDAIYGIDVFNQFVTRKITQLTARGGMLSSSQSAHHFLLHLEIAVHKKKFCGRLAPTLLVLAEKYKDKFTQHGWLF